MTLPTYAQSLLPVPATPTERTFAALARRVSEIPAPIDTIYRPYEVTASFIPFIAWQFSVDLWDDNWPEAKKRWLIAESIRLHRLKGTLPGIDAYLRIVGSKVVKATTPPAKIYLGKDRTPAERQAYLDRFAQLIVRPYVARTTLDYAAYTTVAYNRSKAFVGGNLYPTNVGDHARYTRRAYVVDNGVETQITLRETVRELTNEPAVGCDEIVRAVTAGGQIFLDQTPKARIFFGTDADPAMVLYRVPRTGFRRQIREIRSTILPNKPFVDIKPEYVRQQHDGQLGAIYPGSAYIGSGHMPPTISWRYIFERWYLFDRARASHIHQQGSTFVGTCRFGLDPFTAILRAEVRGKAQPREVWGFVAGCMRQHDAGPLEWAMKAIRRSKAARDTIWVTTKTRRNASVGDRITVGERRKIGQVVTVV